MKRVLIGLIFGILLFGMLGIVSAEDELVCDSDNLDLCLNKNECESVGGEWESGACVTDSENNEGDGEDEETGDDDSEGMGLGQTIRNRVNAGIYTNEAGEQIRIREMAQNRIELMAGNVSVSCDCNMTQEQIQNRTRLNVQLNNGRNAEIKIMPDSASERALERLRLKVCSSGNNCSLELKEVGRGDNAELRYELQIERHSRILGIFQKKMQVRAEVNAENGDVKINKPWWAFLASEPEETDAETA